MLGNVGFDYGYGFDRDAVRGWKGHFLFGSFFFWRRTGGRPRSAIRRALRARARRPGRGGLRPGGGVRRRRPRTSASATSTRRASSRATAERRRRRSASTGRSGLARRGRRAAKRRSTCCAPRCATRRGDPVVEEASGEGGGAAEGHQPSTSASSRTFWGPQGRVQRRRTSEMTREVIGKIRDAVEKIADKDG